MADLLTIHHTKPANRIASMLAATGILALVAAAGGGVYYAAGGGAAPWLAPAAALLVAGLLLLTVGAHSRSASLERDGAGLVYRGLLGRRRELRALTEVVGRSVRPWSSSPALRIVVFREEDRDALRLLAFNWDLDALDRLADDLLLPIRNETVRPGLPRPRAMQRRPRIA